MAMLVYRYEYVIRCKGKMYKLNLYKRTHPSFQNWGSPEKDKKIEKRRMKYKEEMINPRFL